MAAQPIDRSAPADLTCLALAKITIDQGIQSRVELDTEAVAEYREALARRPPAVRPVADPVIVYRDHSFSPPRYWLAAGFHWVQALLELRAKMIECEVRIGSRRDAVLCSAGSNKIHGRRRTNADKRRAVCLLLDDEVIVKTWPNTSISEWCGVGEALVRQLKIERARVVVSNEDEEGPVLLPLSHLAEDDLTAREKLEEQEMRSWPKAWRQSYKLAQLDVIEGKWRTLEIALDMRVKDMLAFSARKEQEEADRKKGKK